MRSIHDSFSMVLIMGLLGERQDGLRRGPAPMAKLFPRQSFSLPKDLVMDEGFPPRTVGFMGRKREKEQDSNKRGEQLSQP